VPDGSIPVQWLGTAGSGGNYSVYGKQVGRSAVYDVHADHLGTPQVLTDRGQEVVWSARYEPFGEADLGTETITNNLRFPGQYFDAETGLHYNYFRDYDATTGRYLQADPLGTTAGTNLFGYAAANPVRFSDVLGLWPYIFRIIFGGGVSYGYVPIPGQAFDLEVSDPIHGEVCHYSVACIGVGYAFRGTPTVSLGSSGVRWDDGSGCGDCRKFEGTGPAGSVAAQAGPVGYTFVDWIDVPNGPRLDLSGYSPATVSIGGGIFFCRFRL
jgi:RHS repeat-associated protein